MRQNPARLWLLFGNARCLGAGLGEIHEAAELTLAIGIETQQERGEILTANIDFVFVDFHRDVTVANDVRPGFRQAN
jgi:hypothetical protein